MIEFENFRHCSSAAKWDQPKPLKSLPSSAPDSKAYTDMWSLPCCKAFRATNAVTRDGRVWIVFPFSPRNEFVSSFCSVVCLPSIQFMHWSRITRALSKLNKGPPKIVTEICSCLSTATDVCNERRGGIRTPLKSQNHLRPLRPFIFLWSDLPLGLLRSEKPHGDQRWKIF